MRSVEFPILIMNSHRIGVCPWRKIRKIYSCSCMGDGTYRPKPHQNIQIPLVMNPNLQKTTPSYITILQKSGNRGNHKKLMANCLSTQRNFGIIILEEGEN